MHGYFRIEESKAGQASEFLSLFDVDIIRAGDHLTFETLSLAPDFAIAGGTYLGATAIKTYEGKPWDIMLENSLVYNFLTDEVVPISTITQAVKIDQAGKYFVTNGLLLPGSVTDDGKRVTDYAAWFSQGNSQFIYSEIRRV